MMRRSSLSAAVALRQLGQRGADKAQVAAPGAVKLAAFDLSLSPPQRIRQSAAATRVAVAEQVPFASTRDPLNPALQAAQAKDAALLAKVLEDFMVGAGSNWKLEITTVEYAQALPQGKSFSLDPEYLAALALARGASIHSSLTNA